MAPDGPPSHDEKVNVVLPTLPKSKTAASVLYYVGVIIRNYKGSCSSSFLWSSRSGGVEVSSVKAAEGSHHSVLCYMATSGVVMISRPRCLSLPLFLSSSSTSSASSPGGVVRIQTQSAAPQLYNDVSNILLPSWKAMFCCP